ncbi:hypothetical protein DV736_g1401, partial [Chaetothyriales sp. CBS 134916]
MSSASSSLSAAETTALAEAAEAFDQSFFASLSASSIIILATAGAITALAGILAALYFSGYLDDILEDLAKKYYEGKAKSEATNEAKSLLKGGDLKNPIKE